MKTCCKCGVDSKDDAAWCPTCLGRTFATQDTEKIVIAKSQGIVLDYLVSIADGMTIPVEKFIELHMDGKRNYSTNPAQAYVITLRELISTKTSVSNIEPWEAYDSGCGSNCTGITPLIAAMRCYATSKFGATFKVPAILLTA